MSDPAGTYIHDPRGPIHTGPGDIIIQSTNEIRRPGPRRQASDELKWIAQRFVYPAGFDRAREKLETHRAVFLEASPGSGRLAAAKVLLWEQRAEAERFHELLPSEEEHRLDLSLVDVGDRIWVDLSEIAKPDWNKIRSELSSLRMAVLDSSAYLVVVLPSTVYGLPGELAQFRARIEPPSAREVLIRHLRLEGLDWPGTLPQLEFLGRDPLLADIPEFVRLVTGVREQEGSHGDLVGWCQVAYRSWSGRRADVGEQVAKLARDGQACALLLTTAMLHEAHADTIYEGSQSLLKIAQHPPDGNSVLQGIPLGQRLQEIGAQSDAAGHVTFERPGYDEAVRVFFWKNSPELHDPLGTWVAQIGSSAAARPDGDLENLAQRFGEQCRAERYRSSWASVVQSWTADEVPVRLTSAASLILQDGIWDKKNSRAFRRQIYEWARRPLSDRLAAVIVKVCRDDMAVNHPDEALVRLHHVARHERGTLAQDALLELARSDRRFFRQLLSRVAGQGPERRTLAVDISLFLQLAEPGALNELDKRTRALIDEVAVQGWLTRGWQLAFAQSSYPAWSRQARQWLQHAADDETHRYVLLDVLIAAARARADTMALLFALRDRRRLADGFDELVVQKISAAQGLSLA